MKGVDPRGWNCLKCGHNEFQHRYSEETRTNRCTLCDCGNLVMGNITSTPPAKLLTNEMFTGMLYVIMSTAAEKQSPDSAEIIAGCMAIMQDGTLVDTAIYVLNDAIKDEVK